MAEPIVDGKLALFELKGGWLFIGGKQTIDLGGYQSGCDPQFNEIGFAIASNAAAEFWARRRVDEAVNPLVEALRNIIKHQDTISGPGEGTHSTVRAIAKKALRGFK